MPAALARLELIREKFNAVGAMHADAVKSLIAVDADKLQANTGLNDDVMAKLLAEADEIGRGSPSLAQTPAVLIARADELRLALQTPAPNYKEVAVNAQQLRSDAQAFIFDHAKQQQEAHASLGATQDRLMGLCARLAQLNEDARIDFLGWTTPVLLRMDDWSSRQDALQNASLDARQAALQEGEVIMHVAETTLDDASQCESPVERTR